MYPKKYPKWILKEEGWMGEEEERGKLGKVKEKSKK